MRVEKLSDHPGDLLAVAAGERTGGLAGQEARLAQVRHERDRARAQRRWLAWLGLGFVVRREKRGVTRLRLDTRPATAQEERAAAGVRGEQSVAAGLGQALGDDWILFQGYRNRRGEIDGLLVGPRGLFAIEVKNHNGTVDIKGDDWSSVKYGRRGDVLRARAPMADRHGRSPSQQLSEPAAALADWLRGRAQQVSPVLVVVLVHPNARIGQVRNPTVHVVTSVQGLLKRVGQSPVTLTARQRTQVEDLIRRDHAHWAGRNRR